MVNHYLTKNPLILLVFLRAVYIARFLFLGQGQGDKGRGIGGTSCRGWRLVVQIDIAYFLGIE